MSSLSRMLVILDCFTPEEPLLTAEEIMARLDYSRGTAYRYLRELSSFGLLSRLEGGFTLGPRIIELDYAIRQYDPVFRASCPIMAQLSDEFESDVILVSFFNDRIVVTHHERGDDKNMKISYGRGERMPLFSGAASKATLACLSSDKQRRLFKANMPTVAKSHLPSNWPAFRKELIRIEKERFATTFGELDTGNVGVASPILHNGPFPPGSVCMVFTEHRYKIIDKALVANAVIGAADAIRERVAGLVQPKEPAPVPEAARTSRTSRATG